MKNRCLSCCAVFALLTCAVTPLRADPEPAPKIEVAKDLPPKERERLQLAVDALTKDRPNKKLKDAQKKLEKALKSCNADKECTVDGKSKLELFLGIVLADQGKEKDAVAMFERSLKDDPNGSIGGGLSSPEAEKAFAQARAKVPAPAPPPAAASEPKPSDSGFAQQSSDVEVKPLSEIGGAKWQPGVGLVSGEPAPSNTASGSRKGVEVPGFDQSTFIDDAIGRVAISLPFNHYDFRWVNQNAQDTLGGLGFEMRLGLAFPIAEAVLPFVDAKLAFGKAGNDPNFLLFSGGDYEIWNVDTDLRAGIDLELGWFMLGGYGGGFVDYYAPSVDVAGETDDSGADLGPFYGAHLRLGGGLFALIAYTWKAGRLETARYRRIEVGSQREDDDELTWCFYWEERDNLGLAPVGASHEERVTQGFPIERTIGLEIRNF